MKRWFTVLSLALAASFAHPARVGAQSLLFSYIGFDYESPDPSPATLGEPGSGYVGLGTVPFLFSPLVADTAHFQYTYIMDGLSPVNVQTSGTYVIIDYSPGSLRIYEDSKTAGTDADFGTNPPSALAPGTFTDGTLFLGGTLSAFQIVFNTATGSGSFEGLYDVTGGSQLGNFPSNQRKGWTFAGTTGNALDIPPGYAHQVVGQTFLAAPVPARRVTWGQLKNLYH